MSSILQAFAASITGALTPGDTATVTATGIQDSGTMPITSAPATTVWGNNTAGGATPAFNTVLNLGSGAVGAPIYAFQANPGSGMWFGVSNNPLFSTNSKIALELGESGAGGAWVKLVSNNTPTIQAAGLTNVLLQVTGNGTGGVDLMTNGGAQVLAHFIGAGASTVNAAQVTAAATGSGVTYGVTGTDSSIPIILAPKGSGTISSSAPIQYMGAATGTDTITVTPSPAITAYATGAFYLVLSGGQNATTTPTLNINSLGAKTIVKRASTAMAAGDILSGMMCLYVYDGTNMHLLNPVVP